MSPSFFDTDHVLAPVLAGLGVAAATHGLSAARAAPPSSTHAGPSPSEESPVPSSPDRIGMKELFKEAQLSEREVFDYVGLEVPNRCIDFTERRRLHRRRRRWRRALEILAHTDPDAVYDWLIGTRQPPDLAVAEARHQRDCLIGRMLEAAADHSDFSAPLGKHVLNSNERLRQWKRLYPTERRFRRRVHGAVVQSHVRSARAQASIWRDKYLLEESHFNRVTPEAAEKCGLPEGASWKAEYDRYRHCWFRILDGPGRERQILTASSAPGISRHHWGTEFDLFGLNPHRFYNGRVFAEEYAWLTEHALDHGFFQTYQRPEEGSDQPAYINEPWHWSYYPIGQALTSFAAAHEAELERRLNALWDRLERSFREPPGRDYEFFDYVRRHWRGFVFHISVPDLPSPSNTNPTRDE